MSANRSLKPSFVRGGDLVTLVALGHRQCNPYTAVNEDWMGRVANVEPRLKALMLRGLDGERAAYGEMLRILTPFLRAHFRRRLGGDGAEAEDLVQETLLAIHLKRDTYERAQPVTPWIYGVARYKLLDYFRRSGARRTIPIEEAGALFASETADEGAVRRDVMTLLARLPGRQAQLLRDVKLAGFSMEEAAERAGVSTTAAKVSVHRSMRRLMREVGDEDG